jgi:hypothetical protein
VTPSRRFPNPLVGELIEAMKTKGMKIERKKTSPQKSIR